MSALVTIKQTANPPAIFTEALELANDFAKASKSAAT
jgi:site-specific recombinase XerD